MSACSICGGPLLAGQYDHHRVCDPDNRTPPHRLLPAEGQARMAHARQGAGVPLSDADLDALAEVGEL